MEEDRKKRNSRVRYPSEKQEEEGVAKERFQEMKERKRGRGNVRKKKGGIENWEGFQSGR